MRAVTARCGTATAGRQQPHFTRLTDGFDEPEPLPQSVGFWLSRWRLPFIWKACEMMQPLRVASLPDQRTIAFGAQKIPLKAPRLPDFSIANWSHGCVCPNPDTIIVRAKDTAGGLAQFLVSAEPGYYALVVDGSDTRLYRVASNTVEEFTNVGGGVSWPQSAARVKLACDVPAGGGLTFDEVTVWARPLQPQAVLTMGKRFFNTVLDQRFIDKR